MTLTVAEIERWDAGDVREVFHAASDRAQAARDAANGIATLPALATWGGVAAAAAKAAIGKTRRDLDAHGREALVVANAARSAAEEIERIKSELATLRGDTAALGLVIDAVSGRAVAGARVQGHVSGVAGTISSSCSRGSTSWWCKPIWWICRWPMRSRWPTGPRRFRSLRWPRFRCPAPTLPAGNPAESAPKTWKDLVLPPEAQEPATVATPTLPDTLFPPGGGADPAATPKTLDEALFPPGGPQPAAGAEPAGSAESSAARGSRRFALHPVTVERADRRGRAVGGRTTTRQRQHRPRQPRRREQSRLNAAAANGYTAGAGGGPGRDATDTLSQSVFDARRELTEQTAILSDLNQARTEVGGQPVGVPALPENAGVQSFPPSPSFASQAAAGLTESSHDINRATFGLVPDVAKDIDVFANWGQHSGADRAGARHRRRQLTALYRARSS